MRKPSGEGCGLVLDVSVANVEAFCVRRNKNSYSLEVIHSYMDGIRGYAYWRSELGIHELRVLYIHVAYHMCRRIRF